MIKVKFANNVIHLFWYELLGNSIDIIIQCFYVYNDQRGP